MAERRAWFTPAEIVAVRSPDLPATVQGFNRLAAGWRGNPAKARRGAGRGWEYHLTALPTGAQLRLSLAEVRDVPEPAPKDPAAVAAWARYEALPANQKDECRRRLDVLVAASAYAAAGLTETAATQRAAAEAEVSTATVFNWKKAVRAFDRADWLAALAPAYAATATFAACHEKALEALKTDWLRPEKPAFSACFRRMRKLASKNGWLPIPSERALRRRIEAEVPEAVRILAREGAKKAKTLYPAQQRSRAMLHAMEAVNMDGHKLDAFVLAEDGRVIRMQLLALQDLYSGKVVAWRLSETENKETVRLTIGDMVQRHGIPEKILLDNGRAFTSKWISGGAANRYRFKIRDEDPKGLLTSLGVEIVWAKPYSGQSKPIERAFRDLAEGIAKHPFCAGAYTGNTPDAKPENYASRAIPMAAFREHVAREIAEHNARPGRRLETCDGRSFDETFEASMATSVVDYPSDAQRALWLLAADKVRTRKGSGEIHLADNRYWAPALNGYAGKPVVVRFDPDRLQEALHVYTIDDRFICRAECIARTGFFDAEAARTHARDRGAYEKALREQKRLTAKMSIDELARMLSDEPAPEPKPVPPRVKRLATGGAAAPAAFPTATEDAFDAAFSRGLRLLGDELGDQFGSSADVIPFTPRRNEHG